MSSSNEQQTDFSARRIISKLVKPERRRFAAVAILSTITALATIGGALLVRGVYAGIGAEGSDFYLWYGGYLATMATSVVAEGISDLLAESTGVKVARKLQRKALRHIMHNEPNVDDNTLRSTFIDDVDKTRDLIPKLATMLGLSIRIAGSAVGLVIVSAPLAALYLTVGTGLCFFNRHQAKKNQKTEAEIEERKLALGDDLSAKISRQGRRLVRAHGKRQRVEEDFLADSHARQNLRKTSLSRAKSIRTIANLSRLLLIMAPLYELGHLTTIPTAVFMTITQGGFIFVESLNQLLPEGVELHSRVSAAHRVENVSELPSLVPHNEKGLRIAWRTDVYPIQVKNVSVVHADGKVGLQITNLTIGNRGGSSGVTALVGRSGSGKTTLLNAIAREKDVTSGVVSVFGVDVRWAQSDSLNQFIGYVPQDPWIFRGSVRQNLLLALPARFDNADAKTIDLFLTEVLEHVHLNASLDQEATSLSGGQIQRLAIGRELMNEKLRLLLLDEATSGLDPHLAGDMYRMLYELSERSNQNGRPINIIFCTHQLVYAKDADQLVVIDDGRVIANGRHADLLWSNAAYLDLWGQATNPSLRSGGTPKGISTTVDYVRNWHHLDGHRKPEGPHHKPPSLRSHQPPVGLND